MSVDKEVTAIKALRISKKEKPILLVVAGCVGA